MVAVGVPTLFAEIEKSIRLHGSDYWHIKRAISHHLIGATLMPLTYQLNDVRCDSRVNLMVVLPTGHGKTELRSAVHQFADSYCPFTYASPTSWHPEQLIGKTKNAPKKKGGGSVTTFGYLSYHFLVFEEAYRILTGAEEHAAETRKVLAVALDTFGGNQIEKKLIDSPDSLQYFPICSVMMLWQPQPILLDVWRGGLARRFLWLVLPALELEESIDIVEDAITTPPVYLSDIAPKMALLISQRVRLGAAQAANTGTNAKFAVRFANVERELMEATRQGCNIVADHAQRCRGLAQTLRFTILHMLMKFSANYAVAWEAEDAQRWGWKRISSLVDVTKDHLQFAMEDLNDYLVTMVQFLDQHLELPWARTHLGQAIQALLFNHGPMSGESVIDSLRIGQQLGPRVSDEDVRRELNIMLLLGILRYEVQNQLYSMMDPWV